jgi:hypothetical protein
MGWSAEQLVAGAMLVGTAPSGVEHQPDATSPNTPPSASRGEEMVGAAPSGVEHQPDATSQG